MNAPRFKSPNAELARAPRSESPKDGQRSKAEAKAEHTKVSPGTSAKPAPLEVRPRSTPAKLDHPGPADGSSRPTGPRGAAPAKPAKGTAKSTAKTTEKTTKTESAPPKATPSPPPRPPASPAPRPAEHVARGEAPKARPKPNPRPERDSREASTFERAESAPRSPQASSRLAPASEPRPALRRLDASPTIAAQPQGERAREPEAPRARAQGKPPRAKAAEPPKKAAQPPAKKAAGAESGRKGASPYPKAATAVERIRPALPDARALAHEEGTRRGADVVVLTHRANHATDWIDASTPAGASLVPELLTEEDAAGVAFLISEKRKDASLVIELDLENRSVSRVSEVATLPKEKIKAAKAATRSGVIVGPPPDPERRRGSAGTAAPPPRGAPPEHDAAPSSGGRAEVDQRAAVDRENDEFFKNNLDALDDVLRIHEGLAERVARGEAAAEDLAASKASIDRLAEYWESRENAETPEQLQEIEHAWISGN